mmetsp:Transcript_51211/g.108842  ORF Transcript_51211/g.108842 Transcript_51211/m.108842 type:complete len:88 (-) Transcript_51211:690-953(-)
MVQRPLPTQRLEGRLAPRQHDVRQHLHNHRPPPPPQQQQQQQQAPQTCAEGGDIIFIYTDDIGLGSSSIKWGEADFFAASGRVNAEC